MSHPQKIVSPVKNPSRISSYAPWGLIFLFLFQLLAGLSHHAEFHACDHRSGPCPEPHGAGLSIHSAAHPEPDGHDSSHCALCRHLAAHGVSLAEAKPFLLFSGEATPLLPVSLLPKQIPWMPRPLSRGPPRPSLKVMTIEKT